MFKKMSTPVKAVLCTVFAASVVGACVTTAVLSDRNDITHSIDSMTDRAKEFYDSGEKEKAYYQLQIYCQERNNDADAWIMLGDWYMKDGTTEEAVKCYKKAAAISKTKTNAVDQLRRTITLSTLIHGDSQGQIFNGYEGHLLHGKPCPRKKRFRSDIQQRCCG